MKDNDNQTDFLPEIRVGKLGILEVHQISEDELQRLIQGTSQSLFLNFGVALLSIFVSFFISLNTTKIDDDRTYYVFVIITFLCLVTGIVMIVLWLCTKKSMKILAKEIRERLPPVGESKSFPISQDTSKSDESK